MGADMPDLRALVSRTPPEGLREWVLETRRDALNRYGLVYEAEYVECYDPYLILDERSKSKKVKMVRVTCSCCGKSGLMDWAKDETHSYGFVHPDDEDEEFCDTVVSAGDETFCPMCGERVLVNKRAAVRDYYVAAECDVMSAGLVGEQNLLALTGWTVQRRVSRSGGDRVEMLPAEAYVFSPTDCAQLMGWRNGYSGAGGYFIQYGRRWRQPKHWTERWGETGAVFGLNPELVAQSCLPNCKLDVYMGGGPGAARYPVAYLRLYQMRPNVEHVLIHGLPLVLRNLIAREAESPQWRERNVRGLMDLPELDWSERRPAQMLRLTKEELRVARGQGWGVWAWDLFVCAKEYGELLTAADIENAFQLGADNAAEIAGRGPVAKSIRYLLRQCEDGAVEDEDPDSYGIPDVQTLLDYWYMAKTLGRDLNDPSVRFPASLLDAHDRMTDLMRQREADSLVRQFRIRRRQLRKYSFAADGLFIRPAASQKELTAEGDALRHCVGTYGRRYATGETAIFFIRRASRPGESWYTLELDEKKLEVRQNRGMRNCVRTPEVRAFEERWLSWIRAGAPRDQDGKPVCWQKGSNRKGSAA